MKQRLAYFMVAVMLCSFAPLTLAESAVNAPALVTESGFNSVQENASTSTSVSDSASTSTSLSESTSILAVESAPTAAPVPAPESTPLLLPAITMDVENPEYAIVDGLCHDGSHDSLDEHLFQAPDLRAAYPEWKKWAQDGPDWKNIPLGTGGYRISNAGCALISVTKLIVQAGARQPEDFTPATLCNWLNGNGGFVGSGILWGAPCKLVSGLTYHGKQWLSGTPEENEARILEFARQGYYMVPQVGAPGNSHYVCVDNAKSIEEGRVIILDTLGGVSPDSNAYWRLSDVGSWRNYGPNVDSVQLYRYAPPGQAVSLTLQDVSYPLNKQYGKGFPVKGTVVSGSTITNVTVGVKKNDGSWAIREERNPAATSWNLLTVDALLVFDGLDYGNYTYCVSATDASGAHVELTRAFTVTDRGTAYSLATVNASAPPVDSLKNVTAFVTRMYEKVLSREPDEKQAMWINQLMSGENTASGVAYGFLYSPEFTKKPLTNAQRIEIMYETFLNRASDASGHKMWTTNMNNGMTIAAIAHGFTQSGEFSELCQSYGIRQGEFPVDNPRDKNAEITAFVARLYQICLGRAGEPAGLDNWCKQLLNKKTDGIEVARGFILSPEIVKKQLSNDAYVELLYLAFMDRKFEAHEKEYWLNRLAAGESREMVFEGFAYSEEFSKILASFHLQKHSAKFL